MQSKGRVDNSRFAINYGRCRVNIEYTLSRFGIGYGRGRVNAK